MGSELGRSGGMARTHEVKSSWSVDTSLWPESNVRDVADELAKYDLVRNVAELELFGFTVVHADQTGVDTLIDTAVERVLHLVEDRSGAPPHVRCAGTPLNGYGRSTSKVLHKDRVFQQLMMHPMALALVTYLLGKRCLFSTSGLFMKGPATSRGGADERVYLAAAGERLQLGLHADYTQRPSP